ncbi:hypothetical protein VaNZ11_005142, partial [Volvox africanus]
LPLAFLTRLAPLASVTDRSLSHDHAAAAAAAAAAPGSSTVVGDHHQQAQPRTRQVAATSTRAATGGGGGEGNTVLRRLALYGTDSCSGSTDSDLRCMRALRELVVGEAKAPAVAGLMRASSSLPYLTRFEALRYKRGRIFPALQGPMGPALAGFTRLRSLRLHSARVTQWG